MGAETLAIIATAATVAGSAYAASQGAAKLPSPAAAPAVPSVTDPAVQAAAQSQQAMAAQAAGRTSTILTSGQGDTSTPVIQKSTLLGG
jgi:hypothetical protein